VDLWFVEVGAGSLISNPIRESQRCHSVDIRAASSRCRLCAAYIELRNVDLAGDEAREEQVAGPSQVYICALEVKNEIPDGVDCISEPSLKPDRRNSHRYGTEL